LKGLSASGKCLPFSGPPSRRRVIRAILRAPQGNQVISLVRIAAHLRAILAAHVPLKLVDRCRLGPADHIERNLDAQRAAVANYLNGGNWSIVAEFTEIESGRKSDRPELDKALSAARLHRCPLVVSKVDRLTRSVGLPEPPT
jgi:hypothetical protein